MPLYTFTCSKCKKTFEVILRVSERDLPLEKGCPSCGDDGITRNVDSGSFIINGYSEANGYARK